MPDPSEWDNQATEVIRPVGRHRSPANDPPSLPGSKKHSLPSPEQIGAQAGAVQNGGPQAGAGATQPVDRPNLPGPGKRRAPGKPRPRWIWPAAAVAALGLLYLVDLLATSGDVPRGVTVAGVDIGGLDRTAAERTLRARLEPALRKDVPIQAGVVRTTLSPKTAGLTANWPGTVAAVGDQPLNPFTRLSSFFGGTDHEVLTSADGTALDDALDGIAGLVRKPPVDGGVRFEGLEPVAVQPTPGAELDVPGAAAQVMRDWSRGAAVQLPVREVAPPGRVSDAAIQRAIAEVAKPAVAAPVRVLGREQLGPAAPPPGLRDPAFPEDPALPDPTDPGTPDRTGREVVGTIQPAAIAGALSFSPDGAGGLKPNVDALKLADAVRPQLARTEQPAKDATIALAGGAPQVQPSQDGRGIDYPATFAGLADILRKPTDRQVTAIYTEQPAKLTTEQLRELGIKDLVSTFSTGGFAQDSGVNIRRAAETINGKIIKPGETFSLNEATGPREAPQGYVPAGIIEDGHPAKGIGGGVSQLATTLYNAAYFAGMTDAGHKEHSYYISRYPVAREATVYEGAIDLKFRNDLEHGVYLQTVWTPTSITVKFWGTKQYEVTSAPSPRSNPVPPPTLTMPAGKDCSPSAGGQGFTATDTRTMRNLDTGQSKSTTRTVRYKPSPKVVCGGPADQAGAPPR
ncbi:VanW family protein [Pseudonocardia eucalypti]|uniref:VanW family protein n=1 Tax=Pseudonocardia eucalypti TaxID=648755 RepID=A0ABP9PKI2_9PSEU|nr:vancomycin resistance protein YoaR [Pseudonocardia eucalypti]